jgi:hypothetical protein
MTENNSIDLLPEIYYKITNEKENHHGFQYKDRLNFLDKEFDEDGTAESSEGGLYFTDKENIHNFLDFGVFIREIRLHTSAKFIKLKDDSASTKYRSNMLYLGKKYNMYSKKSLDVMINHAGSTTTAR